MKTTIKLTLTKRITIEPCKATGGIVLEVIHTSDTGRFSTTEAFHLTPDQAGAMCFGLEQAFAGAEQ